MQVPVQQVSAAPPSQATNDDAAAAAAADDDATAAAAVSGGQGAQPSAGAEVVEECFEIAALELWAVDAPRARALTSCARHELLSAD